MEIAIPVVRSWPVMKGWHTSPSGQRVWIGPGVSIDNTVRVGDHVIIADGTHVRANVTLCDHVSIDTNCMIGKDVFVAVGSRLERGAGVGRGSRIGETETLHCQTGTTVGACAKIGMFCNIGKNATISDLAKIGHNVHVGPKTWIGPSAVIGDNVHLDTTPPYLAAFVRPFYWSAPGLIGWMFMQRTYAKWSCDNWALVREALAEENLPGESAGLCTEAITAIWKVSEAMGLNHRKGGLDHG